MTITIAATDLHFSLVTRMSCDTLPPHYCPSSCTTAGVCRGDCDCDIAIAANAGGAGANVHDYFDFATGAYLGADEDGLELLLDGVPLTEGQRYEIR